MSHGPSGVDILCPATSNSVASLTRQDCCEVDGDHQRILDADELADTQKPVLWPPENLEFSRFS